MHRLREILWRSNKKYMQYSYSKGSSESQEGSEGEIAAMWMYFCYFFSGTSGSYLQFSLCQLLRWCVRIIHEPELHLVRQKACGLLIAGFALIIL
jgi:hypothetical protein